MNNKNKIVFLDRDGTIIVNKHYLVDPAEIEFIPGVIKGLKAIQELGYQLVIVSNQSGVGRGYFTESNVRVVNRDMEKLLAENGINIYGIYYCPHAPNDGCKCRKPAPGMILEGLKDHNGDPDNSWMIGDSKADIGAGQNAGIKTILVRTGYGCEVEEAGEITPDYIVDDLQKAAELLQKK